MKGLEPAGPVLCSRQKQAENNLAWYPRRIGGKPAFCTCGFFRWPDIAYSFGIPHLVD